MSSYTLCNVGTLIHTTRTLRVSAELINCHHIPRTEKAVLSVCCSIDRVTQLLLVLVVLLAALDVSQTCIQQPMHR